MISVRRFCELCFGEVGLDPDEFIEIDPRYFRPAEVAELLGDPSKAREALGWTPKTGVEELARMMVENDLELAKREKTLLDAGHTVAGRPMGE
jgi:GDPmannose 4,6-dehydratase